MKIVYFALIILGVLYVITRTYTVMPLIGMVVCFGLGFLFAKITQK